MSKQVNNNLLQLCVPCQNDWITYKKGALILTADHYGRSETANLMCSSELQTGHKNRGNLCSLYKYVYGWLISCNFLYCDQG